MMGGNWKALNLRTMRLYTLSKKDKIDYLNQIIVVSIFEYPIHVKLTIVHNFCNSSCDGSRYDEIHCVAFRKEEMFATYLENCKDSNIRSSKSCEPGV